MAVRMEKKRGEARARRLASTEPEGYPESLFIVTTAHVCPRASRHPSIRTQHAASHLVTTLEKRNFRAVATGTPVTTDHG
jgi:hypothetical protein